MWAGVLVPGDKAGMTGTLPAEALALATGLFPRHPPTYAQVQQAANVPARARAAIKAFLSADKPEPVIWERPPEQEKLHQDLLAPLGEPAWAGMADHLPMEMLPQWMLVLGNARQYAANKWPTYDAPDLIPANYGLSTDELGDVWEIVRALDGAKSFWADLQAHCLAPAQVAAVAACYPAWYADIDTAVFAELVKVVERKQHLTWQQEDQLRVLRGLPDEAPLTASQPKAPPPRQGAGLGDKAAQRLRTRDERLDSDGAREGGLR
jgi:hypothetical protein